MNNAYPNHTATLRLLEGPVSFRKSEVVSRSWAALQVFGERVRKAMLSELIPGGG